jgi:hypothetical protein
MPDDKLPAYHKSIADPLQQKAITMELEGVGLRFYPLRARLGALQKFCDDYLNFSDEKDDNRPPYFFRPALPFVLLMVLDYNRLEVESVEPPMRNGGDDPLPVTWLRQHELIFGVPLEWYELRKKDRRFRDWAMTSPFIYLDNPISIWIGRDAFGWPKSSMRRPRLRTIFRPTQPQRVASFQIPRSSADPERPETFDRFIDIYSDPVFAPATPQITAPLSMLSSAISSFFQGASAVTASLAGFRLPNLAQPSELSGTQQMMQQGLNTFSGWLPALSAMLTQGQPLDLEKFPQSPFMKNNITLKQFPDAQNNGDACYQALMLSSVTVDKIHGAGLLFNPVLQDPSGGIIVRLHRSPQNQETDDIITTLGLEVDGVERISGAQLLKPYFPFWFDLDLKYEPGEVLSWRGMTTKWSEENKPGDPRDDRRKAPYVTIGSGALPARQRRSMTDVVVRVLPLKASRLDQLCRQLTELSPRSHTFRPASSHLLLYVLQFKALASNAASGSFSAPGSGLLADTEIVFGIPAIWTDVHKTDRRVLLPMLGFVGAEKDAFSDREIYGRLSLQSSLLLPRENMLEDLPPDDKRFEELFYVGTSLCRALNENEETRLWPILDFVEVVGGRSPNEGDVGGWLKDLGLETVMNGFSSMALKQFRDGQKESVNNACYQALVKYDATFSDVATGWIPQNLALRVYEFESVNIVEHFGLQTSNSSQVGRRPNDHSQGDARESRYEIVEPVKPFWLKARLSNESAQTVCCREGAGSWRDIPNA